MGNVMLKDSSSTKKVAYPPILDECQVFSTWSLDDLYELKNRFNNHVKGFALVEAQFESVICFKAKSIKKTVDFETLFDILDNDNDGKIDGLELLGGITLCCKAR